MLMDQKKSKCRLYGFCSFHLTYKGYTFCLSEVLGKGCEVQQLEKIEKESCQSDKGINSSLSLFAFNHLTCPSDTFQPEK
jgi:hypothetical protein